MKKQTTKRDFDYKAAAKEVAAPIAATLNSDALALYRELRDAPEHADLKQGSNLDVPISHALRVKFGAIPSADLALASRVIHYLYHWGGRIDQERDTRGASWKFSNMADAILRERLGIAVRGHRYGNGYHFEVLEGALRLCASTSDSWSWEEVCPATEKSYQVAIMALEQLRSKTRPADFWGEATKAFKRSFVLCLNWRALLDVGENYMRLETECSDSCPECGKRAIFGNNPTLDHEPECLKYPAVKIKAEYLRDLLDGLVSETEKRGVNSANARSARLLIDDYIGSKPSTESTPRTAHHCLPGDNA